MIKMHRRISEAVIVLTMSVLFLTGCTSEASSISSAKNKTEGADVVDTGFTMSTVGSYDSADTAVVLSTDEANKAVTFINMETGKQYTLYYDGTTYVKDKHDGPMTISQIEPGDVVDVTFLKGKKKLASIKLSPDAWVYDDVYNYDLAGANRTASIGSQSYSLPESVVVLSEGRRVDKAEVVSQDVVTISGIEHKIYSINVDKGHGYLSLKNEQPLLGGWIEVGNNTIRQITEDMLLVVPEGTYQVVLNNNGIGCVKDVTIERDKEVVLDVDDIEIPEDATGKILFSVTPENATVSVDGKPVDISKVVELSYGIHRVEASASGYDTLTKHIQVGSEYATISFKLEETRKEDDSVSGNSITRDPWKDSEEPEEDNSVDVIETTKPESVSDNALRASKNGTIDVIVTDATEVDDDNKAKKLEDVTVRLEIKDSNKKVIGDYRKKSPCSFTKVKEGHTYQFTLSKEGYETKTFEPSLLEDYLQSETHVFSLQKKSVITTPNKTDPSNEGISRNAIIAITRTNCSLIKDKHAIISPDSSESIEALLTESGKQEIKNAVKNAVGIVDGIDRIDSYGFEVQTALRDVKGLESENYEGIADVTVSRNGYKEENIPVNVVIKPEAEEPDQPAEEITVTVSTDAEDDIVAPGEMITFTAEVKQGEHFVPFAIVKWEVGESGKGNLNDDWKEFGINQASVSVKAEVTGEFTVKATYTDEEGTSYPSNEVTVTIKAPEEEPENPTPIDPGTPVDPTPTEPNTPVDPTPTDSNTPVDPIPTEPNTPIDPTPTDPDTPVDPTLIDPDTSVDSTPTNSDNSDDMKTQTFSVTQNSHPIRDFFSSLFK